MTVRPYNWQHQDLHRACYMMDIKKIDTEIHRIKGQACTVKIICSNLGHSRLWKTIYYYYYYFINLPVSVWITGYLDSKCSWEKTYKDLFLHSNIESLCFYTYSPCFWIQTKTQINWLSCIQLNYTLKTEIPLEEGE